MDRIGLKMGLMKDEHRFSSFLVIFYDFSKRSVTNMVKKEENALFILQLSPVKHGTSKTWVSGTQSVTTLPS